MMDKVNNSNNYTGPHFILNVDYLQPGDIILERGTNGIQKRFVNRPVVDILTQ